MRRVVRSYYSDMTLPVKPSRETTEPAVQARGCVDFRWVVDIGYLNIKHAIHASNVDKFSSAIEAYLIGKSESFSLQCLQDLIYYICHGSCSFDIKLAYLNKILEMRPNILGLSSGIVIWSDPKEGYTALSSVSRNGFISVVEALLEAASKAYGGEATDGFRRYIEHANKDQFSPLNSASCAGHEAVVKRLMVAGMKACGMNLDSYWFQNFRERRNKHGYSPLNAACAAYSREPLGRKEMAYQSIIDFLLRFTANPASANTKGYTPKSNAATLFGPFFGPRRWSQSPVEVVRAVEAGEPIIFNRSQCSV